MKYLVYLAMLFLTACASTSKTDSNNTIKVIGSGNTYEQAKQDGFKQAIEIIVGTVLVSGKETHDDILTKNDIVVHSAGYVDDYKIVNQYTSLGKTNLVMEVTVRDSLIAQRILTNNKNNQTVEGSRLADQYNTYMTNRYTGDELIDMYFNDFPKHAFNVTKGNTKFMLDGDRNSVLVIPFELHWNYKYLVATSEMLSNTSEKSNNSYVQRKVYISGKDPNAWLVGWTKLMSFEDNTRFTKIKNALETRYTVYVNFYDASNTLLNSVCGKTYYNADWDGYDTIRINGNDIVVRDEIIIPVSVNGKPLSFLNNSNRIEVVYQSGKCRQPFHN